MEETQLRHCSINTIPIPWKGSTVLTKFLPKQERTERSKTRHEQCAAGLQWLGTGSSMGVFCTYRYSYGGRRHYQPLFDRKTPISCGGSNIGRKEHVR
jgi:hypothetical protein